LYATGLAVKDALRTAGMMRTKQLKWPVVSVGSLSAGGAGKTPVVIALAQLLRERGWTVDVLSRGYGRTGRGMERVDPELEGAADRFGDEPVVIARSAQVRVWVGGERFAAGSAAEACEGPLAGRAVHLLDDGFQHRQLVRAMDVVLVTAQDLEDALLPAGNRREPLRAMRRADAVVLREEEREALESRVRHWMRPDAAIWIVRRTLTLPGAGTTGQEPGLVAFCAIARPQNFADALRQAHGRVIDLAAFPDHHRYTAADMERLVKRCREHGGETFITTEKDAVKITPALRAVLEAAAPMVVAGLRAEFLKPEEVVQELEARCR
jgi:tetraacyldisaccharide 4'-kinase